MLFKKNYEIFAVLFSLSNIIALASYVPNTLLFLTNTKHHVSGWTQKTIQKDAAPISFGFFLYFCSGHGRHTDCCFYGTRKASSKNLSDLFLSRSKTQP